MAQETRHETTRLDHHHHDSKMGSWQCTSIYQTRALPSI
ncbi:hypothetical protein BZL30_9224 [Mycobacterium kansasii]|uniref:Uncharacterized protein n=1 Tax=Mycobacterium kansasii TaxID=1768 RepID=A0A1V3XEM0_MYCKA|nr:hypothetical protein BZL30_9224 [Mycobacterium kansasii]OOK76891.1 hypothetical protein BZL29_3528 [Mycobacterium kansasii]